MTDETEATVSDDTRPDTQVRVVAALVALGALFLLTVGAVAILTNDSSEADTATTGEATESEQNEGWNGVLLGEPTPRPDFTLTDTESRPYDFQAETQGRLTLLFFGYTNCPDICPVHMATLGQVLEDPSMPEPVVVFVTTDPERDDPERLRSWLDQWDTDFVGLTGSLEDIADAEAAAEVASSIRPGEVDIPEAEGDEYEVGHAAQIVAFTPDDQGHVVYPAGVRQEDWREDLPRLLEEFPGPDPGASQDGRDGSATGGSSAAGEAEEGQGSDGAVSESGPLIVSDAWMSVSLDVAAGYVTIENTGEADRLVGASSPAAGRVSLMAESGTPGGHDGGTEAGLDLPTGTTTLEPGVAHIMFEDLAEALEPGDVVPVELRFAEADPVTVQLEVLDWADVAER